MKPFVRITLVITCALLPAMFTQAQDAYPAKPITLIVPFGPGSGTDIATRSLAKYLGESLKVPVVVENKPGANGAIGAKAVAEAKPDGYTLLVGSATTNAANFAFFPGKLGYEPKSFDMVAGMMGVSLALHVAEGSPWKNVRDLVAAAKSGKSTSLSCGSGNAVTQVACEIFRRQAGLDVVTVPYKSTPQALTDVVGGLLSFAFSDTAGSQVLVKGGQLRLLGVAGAQRNALYPEVATLAEQGYPAMQFVAWSAVFAPAGMPAPILEKLNSQINQWIGTPEAKQLREISGSFSLRMNQQEARSFAASEVARWSTYIKESNVRPE